MPPLVVSIFRGFGAVKCCSAVGRAYDLLESLVSPCLPFLENPAFRFLDVSNRAVPSKQLSSASHFRDGLEACHTSNPNSLPHGQSQIKGCPYEGRNTTNKSLGIYGIPKIRWLCLWHPCLLVRSPVFFPVFHREKQPPRNDWKASRRILHIISR